MNRAQAVALSQALQGKLMPHAIRLRFEPAGAETWSVELEPGRVYKTDELLALANYCTQNALALTLDVQALGIV